MQGFTYKGIRSDGLVVKKVVRSLLPPIEPKMITVPGRPGAYYAGAELKPREIRVDFAVLRNSRTELHNALRSKAAWLYPSEPAPLEFDDEPGKYYMATVTGTSDITQMHATGEGQLTFLCADPLLYGAEVTATAGTITVAGTYHTYPVLEYEFTAPAAEYVVTHGNGQYIRVVGSFHTADLLEIDCARARVSLNSVSAMTMLDLSSQFFALEPSTQTITAPAGTQLKWRPRWL